MNPIRAASMAHVLSTPKTQVAMSALAKLVILVLIVSLVHAVCTVIMELLSIFSIQSVVALAIQAGVAHLNATWIFTNASVSIALTSSTMDCVFQLVQFHVMITLAAIVLRSVIMATAAAKAITT